MQIETIENPSHEMMDFFEDKIAEFNHLHWEVKRKIPLVIQAKNANSEVVAGVAAKTFGNWLLIENLWVSENLRGQEMGSKILQQLHQAAIARGCRYALLDTLNFQARGFYEKFGYSVQWTQNEYPKTGCKYFMTKTLL